MVVMPVDMSRERFEELVGEALDEVPVELLNVMNNVVILVEDEPPDGGDDLLGLYEGIPLTARGDNYTGVLPDKITLFAGPLWREARGDEDRLRAAVRHTVAHEVAHHFGISDERLLEIDAY